MMKLISLFSKHWQLFVVGGLVFLLWSQVEVKREQLKDAQGIINKQAQELAIVKESYKTLSAQLELEKNKLVEMQAYKQEQARENERDNEQITKAMRTETCRDVAIPRPVLNSLQ